MIVILLMKCFEIILHDEYIADFFLNLKISKYQNLCISIL